MINKRSFLMGAAGAAGVAGSAVAPRARAASVAADALRPRLPSLCDRPGMRAWQAYMHQPFELSDGVQRWAVQLGHVAQVHAAPGALPSEQFVLGFVNAGLTDVPPGTHRLRHANGQGALVYLSGLRGRGAQALRAEFNLLQTTG